MSPVSPRHRPDPAFIEVQARHVRQAVAECAHSTGVSFVSQSRQDTAVWRESGCGKSTLATPVP